VLEIFGDLSSLAIKFSATVSGARGMLTRFYTLTSRFPFWASNLQQPSRSLRFLQGLERSPNLHRPPSRDKPAAGGQRGSDGFAVAIGRKITVFAETVIAVHVR
jgi:hypothetical protein